MPELWCSGGNKNSLSGEHNPHNTKFIQYSEHTLLTFFFLLGELSPSLLAVLFAASLQGKVKIRRLLSQGQFEGVDGRKYKDIHKYKEPQV